MMQAQHKRLSIKRKIRQAEKIFSEKISVKRCLICGENAEYCMRGIPGNAYCRGCAQDYFKLLSYLEKL
jgi:hypothetical protein